MHAAHTHLAPSDWVRRWSHLVADRPGGAQVLDLACGQGRHSRWLARQGFWVTAVDRDEVALAGLSDLAPGVRTLKADIENAPWPLPGRRFDAVVVTHYLWRPLWPDLLASLAPGGLLLVETFTRDQARIGRPSRPEFLLERGELLRLCADLRIIAYEDGFLESPDRHVQRIAAIREQILEIHPTTEPIAPAGPPPRYHLQPAG
jgi:SAM-dependent methyltransferase